MKTMDVNIQKLTIVDLKDQSSSTQVLFPKTFKFSLCLWYVIILGYEACHMRIATNTSEKTSHVYSPYRSVSFDICCQIFTWSSKDYYFRDQEITLAYVKGTLFKFMVVNCRLYLYFVEKTSDVYKRAYFLQKLVPVNSFINLTHAIYDILILNQTTLSCCS